jgi:hypothetical protein
MQAAHDSGLDEGDRSIHVVVFKLGDQYFVALADQIILDCAYVRNVLDVLIKTWIHCHVFGSDCKPFSVFLSAADVEDEGD